jgi:CcmD family protein
MTMMTGAWKRIQNLFLAVALLVVGAGTAVAQEFEKVENIPRQEIPAGRFVSIAYGIIWVTVVVYVLLIGSKLNRTNQEIAELKRKLASKG